MNNKNYKLKQTSPPKKIKKKIKKCRQNRKKDKTIHNSHPKGKIK